MLEENKATMDLGIRQVVFLGYCFKDSEKYRQHFERNFLHILVTKFLEPGEIEETNGKQYVKRLIADRHITEETVHIVLIGAETWSKRHIDWEIAAALTSKENGNVSGLLGILLPEYELSPEGRYRFKTIPPRLVDNVKSGFAQIYTWDSVCSSDQKIRKVVTKAFDNRIKLADKVDNSRPLLETDLT
jgi:hypothetical protein